jgi:hypothetical protein
MSNKPFARIKCKTRDGQRYDVATIWPSRQGRGYTLQPETQRTTGDYPKMPLSEAVRLAEAKEAFLDVFLVEERPVQREERPRREGVAPGNRKPARRDHKQEEYEDGFDFDSEIPF